MNNFIVRPNSRFLYLEIFKDDILLQRLSIIDEFINNSKNHLYAHHFNILTKSDDIRMLGRDIIGPVQIDTHLPESLKCRDIKAIKMNKIILDNEIYNLPLESIEKIAVETKAKSDVKHHNWELWWSSKEEDKPFFLF